MLGVISTLSEYFYPLYFLALLIFFISVSSLSYSNFRKLFLNITLKDISILLLLLLAGIILRLKYTAYIDLDKYGWDYIETALSIKDYFTHFTLSHSNILKSTHIPGYPFFIFLSLIFLEKISVISFLNVCFSALTIPAVYFIAYLATEDKIASFFSAAILTFSSSHIFYSGYEIPMSISVFFVVLEFLFFVAWLKKRNTSIWLTFIALFFISVNIKVENSVFFPLFAFICARELIKDSPKDLKKYSLIFILLLFISIVFCLPFFLKLIYVQKYTVKPYVPCNMLVSYKYYFKYFSIFVVQATKGGYVFMLLAFAMLRLLRKHFKLDYLILGWLFLSTLVYSYCIEIDARWHTTQVLIPIFIITGYVISQNLKIFFKNAYSRHTLTVALFCFICLSNYGAVANAKKPYSWKELMRDLNTNSENSCIITHDFLDDFLVTKFSLPFLLPQKTWLFLLDKDLEQKLCQCRGTIYYFNPISYGLKGEAYQKDNWERQKQQFAILENKLIKNYDLIRVGTLDLFQLRKRSGI